jgi:hypothetical protein
VIEANRHIAPMRRRDALNDTRINMVLNDARGALRLTTRKYDAIVSQPSHPWTAAPRISITREFMQLAHDHLNPGGVFVQWMNVIFMDEDLIRSLTATLLDVFPELRVYRRIRTPWCSSPATLRSTSEQRLRATGLPAYAPLHYARFGINNCRRPGRRAGARHGRRAAWPIWRRGSSPTTTTASRPPASSAGRGIPDEHAPVLDAYDPCRRDSVIYATCATLSFPTCRRNGVFGSRPSVTDACAHVRRSWATPTANYATPSIIDERQGDPLEPAAARCRDQYPTIAARSCGSFLAQLDAR